MKDFLHLAERGFIVFALLYFTSALSIFGEGLQPAVDPSLTRAAAAAPTQSSPLLLAIQSGVLVVTLFLTYKQWQSVLYVAIRRKFLWAFIGIVMASVLWSAVPNFTLRRSLVFLGATFFGLYLSARYKLNEQMRLLAWALGIAALLSLFFTLAFPSFAIETGQHEGAWRGIYNNKNGLGCIMSLSALNFLLLALDSRRYRYLVWGGFGLSVILLLLSTSKTALAIFLILLLLIPLFRALRWNYSLTVPLYITVLLVGGGVAIWLVGNTEAVANALGRDVTLTGRTAIWAVVLDKISNHPWLGYGYKGFWLGMEGESADIWYETYFMAPHAHNGFLDLALELGLVGLLFFMLSFLKSYLRSVAWLRLNKTTEGLWPIIYLTFLLFYNITESSLLAPENFFWVLYTAVTTSILVQRIQIVESEPFDID